MTTKTALTFVLALIGAGSTFAAEIGQISTDQPMVYTSVVSRASVQAEAQRARAAGQIPNGDFNVVVETQGMGLTRAQVMAEAVEAIRLGLASRGEHNVVPTAEQLSRIHMAGLRALSMTVASR